MTKVGKRKTQGSFKRWYGLLSHLPSGVGVACSEGEGKGKDSFELFRQPTPAFDATLCFAFYYFRRGLKYLPDVQIERQNISPKWLIY